MNWIDSFVVDEILVCNLKNKDLQTKSCCEFLLFCYNLKLRGALDSAKLELLRKIKLDDHIQFYDPLLQICLDGLINIDILKIECVENKFIESTVQGYINYDYWLSLTNKHLYNIILNGLEKKSIYRLTHIIFYSTNFGTNDFIAKIDSRIKNIILDILIVCSNYCERKQNWDLLRELYLSLLYVEPSYQLFIQKKLRVEDRKIKSRMGWYLSDGENLAFYEKQYSQLAFIQKYSLFHTTLICELLEISIQTQVICKGSSTKYS